MAAEAERLEIPFVNATTGLRSTLITEKTESAKVFRSRLAGEVNASAGDLIVIVGGKFKQLDADTSPARLADETGESAELFVFTRDFVVQAQEAVGEAAFPGDDGAAAAGVRSLADDGPAALGDVRAALLGDVDAPLGDEAAVRKILEPVAAWFAQLDHEELSAERETWTAAVTPSADSGSVAAGSGTGSSMAGSPLLATLPSYIRRLRRVHLAMAVFRRTAVERARWAEAAHQRAVDSCRCGDAAVRNLGRLAASLRAKTRAAADRLRPRADRWTRMAARAPTYWSRLEKVSVSRAMLPGPAGETVATLADTVPEGAMRGWAEACGSNAAALKRAVDELQDDVKAFLVGATSQALMRRARQAARQASGVLASAVAGSTASSVGSGSSTATVIMAAITELEATLSEALSEALPALQAEDERAVAAQGGVAEALEACRQVLLRRLGAVAQRQSDIVSLFTRRGAIESAGEVLGEQCAELEHLRSLPKAYAAAAAEAVRRRAFTHELNSRLRDIGEELGRMRAEEAERRDQFNRRLGQHLPATLTPWLQERPPHVEIRCFPTATAVPPVTRDEADAIMEAIGGGGSALAGRSTGGAASTASAGGGSPSSEQGSGRRSPTPGDSSPTETGNEGAAQRRSADVASAGRALRAAADEEARERMRVARLERENASLVAELTALLAVVDVGSDSSSDSSADSDVGSDGESDLETGLPPGMPDLGSPSAAGSPESAAGAVARGLSGVSGGQGSAGTRDVPASARRGAADGVDAGHLSGGVRGHALSIAAKSGKAAPAARAAVSEGGSGSPVRAVACAGSRGQGALPLRPHAPPQRGVIGHDAEGAESDAAAGASGPDDAVSPPCTPMDDAAGNGVGGPDGSSTPPQAVGPVRSPAQRPAPQPHPLTVALLSTRAVSDGESPHHHSPHRSTRRSLQRVYELATVASTEAAKHMGPLREMLEAAQADAERMAAPAYGSAPAPAGTDMLRAASAPVQGTVSATPPRPKATTRTPPGVTHPARTGAEPRSREAGLQLIREAADMAARPPGGHRAAGPSSGVVSGLGIAGQNTPSAVAAASGFAGGRGGQFPLRAAPVLSESEPPTPNRSLHPIQSPQDTDDAADNSGGADEASSQDDGGLAAADASGAGAASGTPVRASAPRIITPGPGRPGDWMGAVTGRPSRLPPTSQPSAAKQLARARSSAALPGSSTTSNSSLGTGAAGGPGQRAAAAAAYAAVAAANAVVMASPGRASATGGSEGFSGRAQEWGGTPVSSRVQPIRVVDVVRRMANQLRATLSVAQQLGKRVGELEQRDQKRVSFLDFRPGDLALFMRAQVRCPATGNPVFVVLHHGCPRFYLSESAADDARDGDEAWPDLVLVRIESVSASYAGPRGSRANRVSVDPGVPVWEAAGTPLYTMTDGIVRTSPALAAAE